MKRDTERKNLYMAALHKIKNLMHVHISKELRKKLNTKFRSLLVNKGDSVKIMRGSHRGKIAKVAKVSYARRLVYLEGISKKNAKGTEVLIAFQPSNLMLTDLSMSKERRKEFGTPEEKQAQKAAAESPKAEEKLQ